MLCTWGGSNYQMYICGMEVDYLIIGQGIGGSLLSWNLLAAGKSVVVIDELNAASASRVAGGIINPVTGKRLVRSWMTEQLLPFAQDAYHVLETELGVPLVRQCDMLDFHPSREASDIFNGKLEEEKEYLGIVADDGGWAKYFRFNYGIGRIAPCLLVDTGALVNTWRERLKNMGALMEEQFVWADCKVAQDHVAYKNIKAHKIICCEGGSQCR